MLIYEICICQKKIAYSSFWSEAEVSHGFLLVAILLSMKNTVISEEVGLFLPLEGTGKTFFLLVVWVLKAMLSVFSEALVMKNFQIFRSWPCTKREYPTFFPCSQELLIRSCRTEISTHVFFLTFFPARKDVFSSHVFSDAFSQAPMAALKVDSWRCGDALKNSWKYTPWNIQTSPPENRPIGNGTVG